jgi:hypothetical protein
VPSYNFAALDVELLLGLEANDEECLSIGDFLNRNKLFCICTETVRREISDIEINSKVPAIRTLASKTLHGFYDRNIVPLPLGDVEATIAKDVAARLLDANLIPGAVKNDALKAAEAACHNCHFLITSREPLVKCKPELVRMALIERDLFGSTVLPTSELLRIIPALKGFGA